MSVSAPAPATGEPTDSAAARPGVAVSRPGAWWVLIAGVVGLIASILLLLDKIEMLKDPTFDPICSINPIISCGSVIMTPQASVFGPPNPLYGIIGFTVVVVTGVLTVARVDLPRWYWAGLLAGTVLAAAFVHWLIFQTLYRIGALCPYCMVVWSVTIPLLVVVASIALRPLAGNAVAAVLHSWRWPLAALWFTAVLLMILVRFWDYWSTLI